VCLGVFVRVSVGCDYVCVCNHVSVCVHGGDFECFCENAGVVCGCRGDSVCLCVIACGGSSRRQESARVEQDSVI
jgi:hypothetical protein